jgi:predicted flavoprotein YhiN
VPSTSSSAIETADIVIVGAGAAGLMAAIHAATPSIPATAAATDSATASEADSTTNATEVRPATAPTGSPSPRILVLESTRDGGRKVLISGGGRCNILPGELEESRFVTDSSPNTLKKILRSWPLAEQRRFFEEELGIPLKLEPQSGKLFPVSDRARDVRDALVRAAVDRGVEFLFETRVVGLETNRGDGPRWLLHTSGGATIAAATVVLATGGLSVPNTGSDGTGLLLARRLGCEMHETYAALTPLTAEPHRFAKLAGISLDVTLSAPAGKRPLEARGGFLITHRGYSGPAVLDVSHLAVRSVEREPVRALPASAPVSGTRGGLAAGESKPRQSIFVRWTALQAEDWEQELAPRRASVAGVLRSHLPTRLAETLQREARVPEDRSLAELRADERRRLVEVLTRFELPWTGHEGYRTAEVTGGGVALSEVDPRTLESRRHPGLLFCGEILDAFGPIGGYNFAWAWATGRAAGKGALRLLTDHAG